MKALKAADPTVEDFGEYWFYPINRLSDDFDLERACGDMDDFDDVPEEMKGYPGLVVSDSQYFSDVWWELEFACEDFEGDTHLSEILDFDGIIADLERCISNKGKALLDRSFSEEEMKDYIHFFDDDSYVKETDEKHLVLARRFIDALCEKGSSLALHIKGYACLAGTACIPATGLYHAIV